MEAASTANPGRDIDQNSTKLACSHPLGKLIFLAKVSESELVVGTGFWTNILSPVFRAGLSQNTRFWTNQIPAAVQVLKSRVNN